MKQAHTILHISASPRGDLSYSRKLGSILATELTSKHSESKVVDLDIGKHFPGAPTERFAAENLMPVEFREENTRSDQLIEQLQMSDVLILSLPMHNFGIPVSLKAWIDQVVRPGRTFDRSESGKVGLLADRPVFIIVTSGGPVGGEYGQTEFISSYLKYVLPTIGLKDIRLLFLDSMLRNEAHMQAQMNQGHAWIADQVALPFPVFEPA